MSEILSSSNERGVKRTISSCERELEVSNYTFDFYIESLEILVSIYFRGQKIFHLAQIYFSNMAKIWNI